MTKKEINKKLEKLREDTLNETLEILEKENKCAVIRPTGWGKTYLIANLIRSGKFNSILFLYPAEVVLDTALFAYYGEHPGEKKIDNVTFMTTAKFARLSKSNLKEFSIYDLIIIDECHKIGGDKTGSNLDTVYELFPEMKVLGATATPERPDAIDILGRYFNNNTPFEYNLHNAFQDGILQKPYYIFCNCARPSDNFDKLSKSWRKEIKNPSKLEELKIAEGLERKSIEISNLFNMDNVIRRRCDEFVDTSYMKFIVFFSGFESLHKHEKKIVKWFKKAYPKHKVSTLEITSETEETAANVNKLKNLTYRKNNIDLILAVDMLNVGYHVDNLTGIVMYRTTSSNIIFVQQLGRALSSGADKPAIVFDCVDNLHNDSLYDILGRESIFTTNARKRKEELEQKKQVWDKYTKYIEESPDKLEDEEIKLITGGKSLEQIKFSSMDLSELNSLERRFNKQSSYEPPIISQEDLIVIDNEAEYNEVIRKVVAETIFIRRKQAFANYIDAGGRVAHKDGRPFTSKKEFLAMQPPENVPLPPFCRVKNETVDDVLEQVLGITS